MRSRLMRFVALAVATSVLTTGCMFTRLVDRAFIGVSVRRPTYVDRKTTGIFLVPITFVLDVATLPIQALLVVILGDQFPFSDTQDTLSRTVASLDQDPKFQRLAETQKAAAVEELAALFASGRLDATSALVLTDDGHWVVTPIDTETRAQLLARIGERPSAVCSR